MFKVENIDNLPIVKTVYDSESINHFVALDYRIVIRQKTRNDELDLPTCLFRHKQTGNFEQAPARHFIAQYSEEINYSEDEWDLVFSGKMYARERDISCLWGAYVVPPDIPSNSKVYIEDLIEDIKVGEFWRTVHFATTAIAYWTGNDIEIDFDALEKQYMPLIG